MKKRIEKVQLEGSGLALPVKFVVHTFAIFLSVIYAITVTQFVAHLAINIASKQIADYVDPVTHALKINGADLMNYTYTSNFIFALMVVALLSTKYVYRFCVWLLSGVVPMMKKMKERFAERKKNGEK